MEMWLVWLIAAVVFGVTEILTLYLISLWFGVGSLAAMTVALLGLPLNTQLVLFVVVSVGLLLSTRPLINKLIRTKPFKTGVAALVGKTGVVVNPVDNVNGTGLVRIGGEEWSAVSADESVIPANTMVKINEIHGVKVVVEKVN